MPIKSGKVTPRERIFAEHYAMTNDKHYAASQAGYAVPRSGASQALARPEVQESVRRIQIAELNNNLLPAAIKLLGEVLANPTENTRNRITAAKIVMDRTLGDKDAGERKALHEMSAEEIQAELTRLRAEAADRARPVIEHEEAHEVHVPSAFD